MLTLEGSAAPSLALIYSHVAINALGLAADVAMNTARWLIVAVERSVIDLTAPVTIDVLASATMGSYVVHAKRLVRFNARTLPVLRLATRRALRVSRNVPGLVLIKDLVQCHAQHHATASLAMKDAPEYYPAVITSQASAGKIVPLVIVRSAATKAGSELICWSSYHMPKLI